MEVIMSTKHILKAKQTLHVTLEKIKARIGWCAFCKCGNKRMHHQDAPPRMVAIDASDCIKETSFSSTEAKGSYQTISRIEGILLNGGIYPSLEIFWKFLCVAFFANKGSSP